MLFDNSFALGSLAGQSSDHAIWSNDGSGTRPPLVSTFGGSKAISNSSVPGETNALAITDHTLRREVTLTGYVSALLTGTASKNIEFHLLDNGTDENNMATVSLHLPAATPFNGATVVELSDNGGGVVASGTITLSGNTAHPFTLTATRFDVAFSVGTLALTGPQSGTVTTCGAALVAIEGGVPLQSAFVAGSLTLTGR